MSVSFEDYVAFVESVSDYDPATRYDSGLCGLISETGELLALFDERRVKRKGLPSRAAILSELGDVLWYEVWRSGERAREAFHWRDSALKDVYDDAEAARKAIRDVFQSPRIDVESYNSTRQMLMSFGFTIEQIAEANMLKLTARRAAGTLHDREARVGDGGAA